MLHSASYSKQRVVQAATATHKRCNSVQRTRSHLHPMAPEAHANGNTCMQEMIGERQLPVLSSIVQYPVRDLLAFTLCVLGVLLLTSTCELLASRGILKRTTSRKLMHVLSGPVFALTWPLFSSTGSTSVLASAVPSLQVLRLLAVGTGFVGDAKSVRSISRSGDRAELLRGPLFYSGVLVLTTAICWRSSAVGLLVISVLCGGDGIADIAGRSIGGPKLMWNKNKSVAGSLSMLLTGFSLSVLFIAYFHSLGYLSLSPSNCFCEVFIVSLSATLVESLPINQFVDDNISVPLTTFLMATLLLGPLTA